MTTLVATSWSRWTPPLTTHVALHFAPWIFFFSWALSQYVTALHSRDQAGSVSADGLC